MGRTPILTKISRVKWLNRWAGSYTFISCSYWGPQYFHSLKKHLGVYFRHTLFIHRKGTASFFVADVEFRHLGKYLAKRSEKDHRFAINYCRKLKRSTDVLLPLMEKLKGRIPLPAEYKKFEAAFDQHLAYHVFVKKTIDFLTLDELKELLPFFKDARVYSEKVYSESESFFRNVMRAIAKREKYNAQYLTCLTKQEFETYLNKRQLPHTSLLRQRYEKSTLYFEGQKIYIIMGPTVDKIDSLIAKQSLGKHKEVRGIAAYPGKVIGRARIIPDPFKVKVFNDGDILITGMTRPEFMPLIRKASAIVTDVGGMLCHAAITAREVRVPCVVGTAVATKVFKNNQLLSVEADKGIVKIK